MYQMDMLIFLNQIFLKNKKLYGKMCPFITPDTLDIDYLKNLGKFKMISFFELIFSY